MRDALGEFLSVGGVQLFESTGEHEGGLAGHDRISGEADPRGPRVRFRRREPHHPLREGGVKSSAVVSMWRGRGAGDSLPGV